MSMDAGTDKVYTSREQDIPAGSIIELRDDQVGGRYKHLWPEFPNKSTDASGFVGYGWSGDVMVVLTHIKYSETTAVMVCLHVEGVDRQGGGILAFHYNPSRDYTEADYDDYYLSRDRFEILHRGE